MKVNKSNSKSRSKIITAVILIIIAFFITNPKYIPFLSIDIKNKIQLSMTTHFGSLTTAGSGFTFNIDTLLALFVALACIYAVYQIIKLIFNSFSFKNRHTETLKDLLLSVFQYASVITAIVWGLSILGVNMAAVFAGIGIIGLVVGFGAQSLIEDIITGVFIIFEGQCNIGDIVSIDNFRGTVASIGVRTTSIVDAGGNIKIINNSDIRNIQNLSNRRSLAICDISMSYGGDIEKAEDVIAKAVVDIKEKYPNVFKSVPEYLGVQALSASSVDLRVMAAVDEPDIYRARRILNRELKIAFDKNNIEIPFPQLVVYNGDKDNSSK